MPSVNLSKLQINYAVQGTGDSFLLFPDNLFAFQAYPHEIETLSKRYQVIAFDYPGVGQSTHDVLYPDEREVDLWGFWADLACHLLLELKINACCVLGVGGGALTALQFAGKQAPQHKLAVG
jgi:pimeloyl-ACP methyl ester carboxylesterase